MLNKTSVLVALSLSLITPPAAWGAIPANTSRIGSAGDTGVGLEFGQPLGLTGKYWMSNTFAADAGAGYHFSSNFDAHADYLLNLYPNFNLTNGGRLPVYLGMGARVLLGSSNQFGFRWPVGASYLLPHDPIELFAEIAPVLVLNNVGLDVDGVVGIRVYLNYLNKK